MSAKGEPKAAGWSSLLVDYAPLLVFFVAYKIAGVWIGTAVFVVAIIIALAWSLVRFGRVTPMTWISAVLIIGFGGLTLYLQDQRFIQMKPTIIYAGFAAFLFAGLLFGKPLLRYLFGPVFEGLSEEGWFKLSRNWALFFTFMAAFNEVLRANVSFDLWVTVKVWGATAMSVLFGLANVPMLMRHGLQLENAEEELPVPPPQ
ncbi:MAG TPA: septation protein IspZ [Allosphingosinicella sp.]|jgi:intracellular septation protein